METIYQYIITGIIIALALVFLARKVKNAIKGGGCNYGCDGCNGQNKQFEPFPPKDQKQ